jgi:hypothetical protein
MHSTIDLRRFSGLLLMVLAVFVLDGTTPFANAQELISSWTSVDGRKISAKFERLDASNLVVSQNGKELIIPLTKLSIDSQRQASEFSEQAKNELKNAAAEAKKNGKRVFIWKESKKPLEAKADSLAGHLITTSVRFIRLFENETNPFVVEFKVQAKDNGVIATFTTSSQNQGVDKNGKVQAHGSASVISVAPGTKLSGNGVGYIVVTEGGIAISNEIKVDVNF